MHYNFVSQNSRLLLFGIIMSFTSSFGQTFFISLFGPSIQFEFGLSHTSWGTIYLIGTLLSAIILTYSGSLIDYYRLNFYTYFSVIALVFSCFFISIVSGYFFLIFAVFLLRQTGQGLTSHISVTTMARYFSEKRGTAIAIGSLGMAIGEAILPFVVIILISLIGWRLTYMSSSIFILFCLFPVIVLLLNRYKERFIEKTANIPEDQISINKNISKARSFTRAEVLKDFRFYLMVPGLMAPGIILTTLFFHHLNIADSKEWSHLWITGNYFVYSISVSLFAILIGSLIDKFSAKTLVIYSLVPIIISLFFLILSREAYTVIPYMFFLGLSSGFTYTSHPAIIAELYGTQFLGSIKSLLSALTVFGSAIGPVIFGGLLDLDLTIETILLYFSIYSLICTFLFIFALRNKYN
tara:strand:- start:3835 stop:5064 length:1230 start_codon:yes stop_codon:yes gene_type:complete